MGGLVEAAAHAMSECPESAPLVEALCQVVAQERASLDAVQASLTLPGSSPLDLTSLRRIMGLRCSVGEGLNILQKTLSNGPQSQNTTFTDMHSAAVAMPHFLLKEGLHTAPQRSPVLAETLGGVAANMQEAIAEIRAARRSMLQQDAGTVCIA